MFSDHSHGFRPKRGPQTFMRAVKTWPPLEKLVQCDIKMCFDSIDHCQHENYTLYEQYLDKLQDFPKCKINQYFDAYIYFE